MSDARPRWRRVLLATNSWLALGLLVRVAHVLSLGNQYSFGDTAEYEQVALQILHGMSFGEASPRAPAYPLLLAFSFWIGGEENYLVAHILQLGLSLVQMLLVVRFAGRLGGPSAATVAAALVALTPTLVFVSGLLYPTLLYATLLFALTFVAWSLAERPSVLRGLALGALVVLGWLTDMVILAPSLAIGVWLLAAVRSRRVPLVRALAVAGLTTVALAAPYLRFLREHGNDRVFMGKAQAVLHFARTDTLISRPRWIRNPSATGYAPLSMRGFVERELGLLRTRPAAYVHDYVFELLHFFQPLPDRVTSRNRFNRPLVLWVGALLFAPLLLLAVFGLLRGAAPREGRVLLASVVLSTAAFYALFFTQVRYRIPVVPHLVVLAAVGVTAAFPRLTRLLVEPEPGPERTAP